MSLTLGARGQFSGTVLAATMPISCGVFGPCLAMGMGMGRAVGEYLRNTFPAGLAYFDQDLSYAIIPATYAITGAAAFSAGVTHTLSTAVIVLEMSGQLNLVAPIMVRVSRPQDRAGCRFVRADAYHRRPTGGCEHFRGRFSPAVGQLLRQDRHSP
jgi:hypothetical protein